MLRRDNLHDYQVRGVSHIIENDCAALFLDCGMGKSATTLTAIKELIDGCIISSALIIAPKRVAEVTYFVYVCIQTVRARLHPDFLQELAVPL